MKAKRVKSSEAAVPHVAVFIYFVCYETLPSKVLAAVGAARVRKNSMIFRLPRPIGTSEQLRDMEHRLSKAIDGNPEVIITEVSFLGDTMVEVTPEQAAEFQRITDEAKMRAQAVAAMKAGVAQAVKPDAE